MLWLGGGLVVGVRGRCLGVGAQPVIVLRWEQVLEKECEFVVCGGAGWGA